jgi:hypothetical protein
VGVNLEKMDFGESRRDAIGVANAAGTKVVAAQVFER